MFVVIKGNQWNYFIVIVIICLGCCNRNKHYFIYNRHIIDNYVFLIIIYYNILVYYYNFLFLKDQVFQSS